MSLQLSAATGEAISPAQLLGEESQDVASREAEAEKDLERLNQKRREAGLL